MRRIVCTLIAAAAALAAAAQSKSPDAVLVSHSESFTLNSPNTGTYKVTGEVLVNNKDGLSQAETEIFTDSFRSLASFSATVTETGSGKKTKVSKKDLMTVSISSGLSEDSFVTGYSPSARFPFLYSYEYTVNYKGGVLSFPAFSPLASDGVQINNAEYRLDVPEGTEIISSALNVEAQPVVRQKGRCIYSWKVKDLLPIVSEEYMPPVRESLPLVLSAPVDFSYAGTTGRQGSWEEAAAWLAGLQTDATELPEATVAELRELTAGCSTDLEKLQVLYKRMRQKTRYVSIQLGIGKLKPIAASEVERTGFGDCKALSNYLKAMLAAVGVESDYYAIHTSRKNTLPGFPSVGQMNHAMLAVPLPELRDTVFVECTNPRYPLGYRHTGAAGHQVILLDGDGGRLERIGAYPDSLSGRLQETEVRLAADGSAALRVRRHLKLDFTESYMGFDDMSNESRVRYLTSGFKLNPEGLAVNAREDNFDTYAETGRAFVPEAEIDYSFKTKLYGTQEAERFFVPANPVAMALSFQKGERRNDIYIPEGYVNSDKVRLYLPEGYTVENVPAPVDIDTEFGHFKSVVSVTEDGTAVLVEQSIRFKAVRTGKEHYGAFRDFARKVNRAYDSSIVLKKK